MRLLTLIVAALAALISTACESSAQTPNDASQNNAIAAVAPTATSEATVTPVHTQTPTTVATTATPDPLNPPTPQPCPTG